MTYAEKLDIWFATQRIQGRFSDIKFFPSICVHYPLENSVEITCQAVYETVTGLREVKILDTSVL